MAVPYHQSSSNWMLPVKVALISTGVLCTALMLKLSLPVVTDFAVSELPSIWSVLISWLKPPYLYVVINCIIVTIVATSKLQHNSAAAAPPPQTVVHLPPPEKAFPDYAASVFHNVVPKNDGPVAEPPQFSYSSDESKVHYAYEQSVPRVPEKLVMPSEFSYGYDATDLNSSKVPAYEQIDTPVPEAKTMRTTAVKADLKVKDGFADVAASESFRTPLRSSREFPVQSIEKPPVSASFSHRKGAKSSPEGTEETTTTAVYADVAASESFRTPLRSSREFPMPSMEKPPVSVRFSHRKAMKSSPEGGRTLGVAKPKRHDTLESTWKTITEGRPMPLTRHLKKSDTWEREGPHHLHAESQRMTKSETFKERGATAKRPPFPASSDSAAAAGRLRREASGSMKVKREPSLGQDELNKRVEAFINNFNEQMRLQRQESMNQYMEMINRGAHSHH